MIFCKDATVLFVQEKLLVIAKIRLLSKNVFLKKHKVIPFTQNLIQTLGGPDFEYDLQDFCYQNRCEKTLSLLVIATSLFQQFVGTSQELASALKEQHHASLEDYFWSYHKDSQTTWMIPKLSLSSIITVCLSLGLRIEGLYCDYWVYRKLLSNKRSLESCSQIQDDRLKNYLTELCQAQDCLTSQDFCSSQKNFFQKHSDPDAFLDYSLLILIQAFHQHYHSYRKQGALC